MNVFIPMFALLVFGSTCLAHPTEDMPIRQLGAAELYLRVPLNVPPLQRQVYAGRDFAWSVAYEDKYMKANCEDDWVTWCDQFAECQIRAGSLSVFDRQINPDDMMPYIVTDYKVNRLFPEAGVLSEGIDVMVKLSRGEGSLPLIAECRQYHIRGSKEKRPITIRQFKKALENIFIVKPAKTLIVK